MNWKGKGMKTANWINFPQGKHVSVLLTITFVLIMQTTLLVRPVDAELGVFQETFDNLTYMDASNTTVTEWGSGVISSPNKSLELVASYDTASNSRSVAIAGDLAYVADYANGLQILDISDPATPTVTGFYNTSMVGEDVFVSGDHVFVADTTYGLWVINSTVPSAPTFLDFYNTPGSPQDVFVDGDYAFVADSFSGLQIINSTDVTDLSLTATYDTGGASAAEGVYIEGDYAFVAFGVDGLVILDITDLENPTYHGSYDTPGYARGVYVDGNHAFLADTDYGLQIINITDPANPTLSGTFDTDSWSYDVFVFGNHAYLAAGTSGLIVLDITDVTNPTLGDSYNTAGSSRDVFVEGHYAYVADNNRGLLVFAQSEPIYPRYAASIATPGIPAADDGGIFTSGNLAYIVGWGKMQVVNISNPENPQILGNCTTPGDSYNVFVAGDFAFIADGSTSGGLQIANVTDPQNPHIVSYLNSSISAYDVFIAGNHAFIGSSAGLKVIDITDVMNPLEIGSYFTPGAISSIDVEGDIAVMCNSYLDSLQIINITNPKNPSLLGAVNVSDGLLDVCIEGDYAYIAGYAEGLYVVDIQDAKNPVVVSNLALLSASVDVFLEGDFAYIAQWNHGLAIINIADPLDPAEVDNYSQSSTMGVCIEGEYAYLLCRYSLEVAHVSATKYKIVEPLTMAQSSTIFTAPENTAFSTAILTDVRIIPYGTSVTYFLSPDNGISWEEVTRNVMHTFVNSGPQLKWKAELAHNDTLFWYRTAEISHVTISYNYILESPGVSLPGGGTPISDNSPFYNWEDIPEASNYSFQLDTLQSFNSSNLIDVIVSASSYTHSSPFVDGVWYWRVAAIDSAGDIGFYSEIDTVSIDTQAPILNNPSDISYIVGTTGNSITWSPTDDHPLSFMVTRDGTEIDSDTWNGEAITVNVDGLSIGSHTYICTVSDSLNHSTSDTIIVTATATPTTTTTETATTATATPTTTTTETATTATSTEFPTPGFDLSYVLIAIAIVLSRKKR